MRLAGDHPSGVLLATVPPLAVCEGKVAVLDHVLSVEEGGEGRERGRREGEGRGGRGRREGRERGGCEEER